MDDDRRPAGQVRPDVDHEAGDVMGGERAHPGARAAEPVLAGLRRRQEGGAGEDHGPWATRRSRGRDDNRCVGFLDGLVGLEHRVQTRGLGRVVRNRGERACRPIEHGTHSVRDLVGGDEAKVDHASDPMPRPHA